MHTAYTQQPEIALFSQSAPPSAPPVAVELGGPAMSPAQIEFLEMKRMLETAYAASGGTVTDADVWMALGKEPPAPKE
jgi:hypothetical protein